MASRRRVSERVARCRAQLRAAGLRPIRIWVPDVHSPRFVAQAHRQSLAVARSFHADEEQGYIDAISEWPAN